MGHAYRDQLFTPSVLAAQERFGARRTSAGGDGAVTGAVLSAAEAEFIAARDGFYVASVSETGWPYVQYRGGPAGFARVLDGGHIGWADFRGNRQYISAGNVSVNPRVSLIFMDYAERARLKLIGTLAIHTPDERPDLATALVLPDYRAKVERLMVVAVAGFDWNCPSHITQRFTLDEIAAATEPLRTRIAELERQAAERV